MQLCPEKGQSSISKGAHTADKNSLATAKLFYSMPFATAQKHMPLWENKGKSFYFLSSNAATGVRYFLVRFSFQSVRCASHRRMERLVTAAKGSRNLSGVPLRFTLA
jgi:hypothetical protein